MFYLFQEIPKQDTKLDGDNNDIAEMAKALKVWYFVCGLYIMYNGRGCSWKNFQLEMVRICWRSLLQFCDLVVALQEKAKAFGKRKAAETINPEAYIASSSDKPHFKKRSKTSS